MFDGNLVADVLRGKKHQIEKRNNAEQDMLGTFNVSDQHLCRHVSKKQDGEAMRYKQQEGKRQRHCALLPLHRIRIRSFVLYVLYVSLRLFLEFYMFKVSPDKPDSSRDNFNPPYNYTRIS